MKNLSFIIVILMAGALRPVYAELPENFRDNLPGVIRDYCKSSLEYALDEPIGEWDDEEFKWGEESQAAIFHKTISCVLDSALEELTEHSKRVAEKAFGLDLPIATFSVDADCGSVRLGTVQAEQQANGFKSMCARSETPEISQIFSSCQVAETVLNEWCGYDLFLYAKAQDEKSFRELEGDLGFEVGERVLRFAPVQDRIEKERRDAEVAVFEALAWYQQTEHAARQNPWMIAMREQLFVVQEEWAKIRSALGKFADKFVNASVPQN